MRWQTTIVLVILVDVYAIVGGLIFSFLEKDHEHNTRNELSSRLAEFFTEHPCVNATDIVFLDSLFNTMFNGGLSWEADNATLTSVSRWDFLSSVFVAVEMIGTVGYWPAAPKTTGGRIFTIFLAFIGIPLFLLSAIGLGQLFNMAADLLLRLFATCRYGRRRDYDDVKRMMDHVYGRRRRLIYRTLIIGLVGFVLFVAIPSWIFMRIEGWTYGEALYYCFLTLVTIGFGDFVPGYGRHTPDWLHPGWYRLCVGCWILIVIAWFSGTVSAIRYIVHRWIRNTEDTVVHRADNAINKPETTVTVDRVGETSVVRVDQSKKKSKLIFWNRSKSDHRGRKSAHSPSDTSAVAVTSPHNLHPVRGDARTASAAATPSLTSTVQVGST